MYTAFIVYCKCGVKKGLPLCLLLLLDVTSTNVKDQMSQNLLSPPFYIVGRGCVGVCVCGHGDSACGFLLGDVLLCRKRGGRGG